ncbi:hypothetical protein QWA68_009964 [Fusarium oxysporum]|nr:hypothetical protein QWA68_009964 [Fusarium oxysporum]
MRLMLHKSASLGHVVAAKLTRVRVSDKRMQPSAGKMPTARNGRTCVVLGCELKGYVRCFGNQKHGYLLTTPLSCSDQRRCLKCQNSYLYSDSPAFHNEGSRRHHPSKQNEILFTAARDGQATQQPMSARSSISKPVSSLRPRAAGMGYHGNPVAVLDMKADQVRPLDKADVEGKDYFAVEIPRVKNNVPIYISRSNDAKQEFIAEVNLWSMGVRYNLHRLLGDGPQLYVVNA